MWSLLSMMAGMFIISHWECFELYFVYFDNLADSVKSGFRFFVVGCPETHWSGNGASPDGRMGRGWRAKGLKHHSDICSTCARQLAGITRQILNPISKC